MTQDKSQDGGGRRMSIGQHLDELRKRSLRSLAVMVILFGVSWGFVDHIMKFLLAPHYLAMDTLQESMDRKVAEELLKDLKRNPIGIKALETLETHLETLPPEQALQETLKEKGWGPQQKAALQRFQEPFKQRKILDRRPIVTAYTESIITYLKACLMISLLVGGPFILWQIWGFIAAGLYPREKRFINRHFPFSLLLFLAGMSFGYFFLIPTALTFLAQFGADLVRPEYFRISQYFSLFMTLTFALGLIFQIPVVMVIFARLGIVAPASYRSAWKFVFVGSFIVSAIVTPTPDPLTQTMVAIPTYLLYEIGILFSKLAYREHQRATSGEAT